MKYRIEKDTIGSVKIPYNVYWGPQTQRSINNFAINKENSIMPLEVIYAYAVIKKAAAISNNKFKKLSNKKMKLIVSVCDEIMRGELYDHFPLIIWQTGSGTQTNMNINEVIVNRAHVLLGNKLGSGNKFLNPNDDVNMSQSSNDTFPTSMHISIYKLVIETLIPELDSLALEFAAKVKKFKSIIKVGRTHCMDAVPVTLGQEFSSYLDQIETNIKILKKSLVFVSGLSIGGTAVGTGLNTPKGYDKEVVSQINRILKFKFTVAKNKFAGISSHDVLVNLHASFKNIAVSLMKIGNDIKMLSSGPRTGIAEIILPANEPGSSIMPGKVNPTQCEALTMVCAKVIGNDSAVNIGGMSGHFQLNAFKPLIAHCLIESCKLLSDSIKSFSINCLKGIKPNFDRINMNINNSLMLVTSLNESLGYDKASEIAKLAYLKNCSLKEACLKLGYLKEKEFDSIVNPKKMV